LTRVPYGVVHHETVILPDRVHDPAYHRENIPPEMYVPPLF
jgi:polyphosphate kinase